MEHLINDQPYLVVLIDKALDHLDHDIELVTYGYPPVNVALECMTCGEVIGDGDI
jgi:hypothetical protein